MAKPDAPIYADLPTTTATVSLSETNVQKLVQQPTAKAEPVAIAAELASPALKPEVAHSAAHIEEAHHEAI